MLQRFWDPRLNPALRPDDWRRIYRRNRILLYLLAFVLLSGLTAVLVYSYYPFDRTEGMTAEEIAQSAGDALLSASGYDFTVDLHGKSTDELFPQVDMHGQYQKTPQFLHMSGEVANGDMKVPVEYYLEGSDLYIRHPADKTWMLLKDGELDELTAFFPDNLAAPFISGIESAEILGRDRLPGGEAVEIRLSLDANVMMPHSPAYHDDRTEYTLWVYTRDLKPARFVMTVQPAAKAAQQEQRTTFFTYELSWEFGRRGSALSAPAAVKQAAQSLENQGDGPPKPDELPGVEGESPADQGGGDGGSESQGDGSGAESQPAANP